VPHNDGQLISLEQDAIFGLACGVDRTEHIVLDRAKKAAFAWSSCGRVFVLNPTIAIGFAQIAPGRKKAV
jgi:hypothetical protein